MRIGIDACCLSNRRGFGRFTRELLTALHRIDSTNHYTYFVDAQTAPQVSSLGSVDVCAVPTREAATRSASADGSRALGDLWQMYRAVARTPLDLFYFPAVYTFFPLPRGMPAVVTFHDATPERLPELIFKSWTSRLFWSLKCALACEQADLIVTVSAAARDELVSTLALPVDRLRVIPEAAGPIFRRLDDRAVIDPVLKRYRLRAPFLLYVGGINPHKNLNRLVRAYGELVRTLGNDAPTLALVGDYSADGFLSDHASIRELVGALGLGQRVVFTGYVSDNDLVCLYNGSVALVLPSLGEGFGLPALEAMACGTPVLASNTGALPELLNETGVLFDPYDVGAMVDALNRVWRDPELRSQMGERGLKRAAQFTWEASARRLLSVFTELAGPSS